MIKEMITVSDQDKSRIKHYMKNYTYPHFLDFSCIIFLVYFLKSSL